MGVLSRDPRRMAVAVGGALLLSTILYLGATSDYLRSKLVTGPLGESETSAGQKNLIVDTHKPPEKCRPYDSAGYLNYDPGNAHANRWTPFLNTCTAPALFASFLRSTWQQSGPKRTEGAVPIDFAKDHLGPDGEAWEDVEWARGKTVLLLGDSVLRFMGEYFCHIAGEDWIDITTDHPWSPVLPDTMPPPMPKSQRVKEPPSPYDFFKRGKRSKRDGDSEEEYVEDDKGETVQQGSAADNVQGTPQHENTQTNVETAAQPSADGTEENGQQNSQQPAEEDTEEEEQEHEEEQEQEKINYDWTNWPEGDTLSHRPHYCYIPGMDMMIINVFFFGLDQDQWHIDKAEPDPPYTVEERLDTVVRPLLKTIKDKLGRTPDLTYVNSGMWDIARFVRQDFLAGRDVEDGLSYGRLQWYRTRVRQIMVSIKQMLPDSVVKWSATHYPLRVLNIWFFDGSTPEIKLNRLVELHEAAVSAILDTQDATPFEEQLLQQTSINQWGLLMRGAEKLQIDCLHPSMLPGGYLWSDMMLYDLREEVAGQADQEYKRR